MRTPKLKSVEERDEYAAAVLSSFDRMKKNTLRVTHTRCRHGKPLATVANLPGEGAELRPAQMRALAWALERAAADCEAIDSANRPNLINETIDYDL